MSTRITEGVSTESPVVIVPTLVLYSSGNWYYGPFRTRFTEATKYGVACLMFSVSGENLYFYQQGSPTDQDIKNMLLIAEKMVVGETNVGYDHRIAKVHSSPRQVIRQEVYRRFTPPPLEFPEPETCVVFYPRRTLGFHRTITP